MRMNCIVRFNDIDWDIDGDFYPADDPEEGYPPGFELETVCVGGINFTDYLSRTTIEILEERAAAQCSDKEFCRWNDERI